MFRFNLFSNPRTGSTSATVTTPAHVALSNQVAEAGTTLLKNSGAVLPLRAANAGKVAVIGPAASAQVAYTGGGSAYVLPSGTVSPLQGIRSAAGSGTTVSYTQGLPTDTSLPAIPASALSPAYAPTPFGGKYNGTLTAPQTGTYVLALTNPCGCYTPTYLKLNGHALLDVPSTPPVHTYSVAVRLQAGHRYHLLISGDSSALTWGTPSRLAPGIAKAVAAAKSASTAVVVVSDDTETEAADRLSLSLPSAQDELISAVAAANPHTVVVINAGRPGGHALAAPGGRGGRRVVPGPDQRHRAGRGAVRPRGPGRSPAGHLPGQPVPGARRLQVPLPRGQRQGALLRGAGRRVPLV